MKYGSISYWVMAFVVIVLLVTISSLTGLYSNKDDLFEKLQCSETNEKDCDYDDILEDVDYNYDVIFGLSIATIVIIMIMTGLKYFDSKPSLVNMVFLFLMLIISTILIVVIYLDNYDISETLADCYDKKITDLEKRVDIDKRHCFKVKENDLKSSRIPHRIFDLVDSNKRNLFIMIIILLSCLSIHTITFYLFPTS